ncbi:hypothetical protein SG34_019160 [Thalassomonas viridans]|uniref:DUF3144 domain-containing protein n=1 Tax=Thalassomonas viridans TaxID=137584 RepID=A0AAE9YYX3_9GAMM|nr:hypothetical protein [Thalassomonas viridans]WDE03498.1 hypothetical protein SG34_019160 [Thalassomonas viridans]
MSESTPAPQNEVARRKAQLSALVDLTDDFSQFHQECAFLCDAFAAVAQEPECISEETSEGIRHMSYWLKGQAKDYYQRIDDLYQEAYSHNKQAETQEKAQEKVQESNENREDEQD